MMQKSHKWFVNGPEIYCLLVESIQFSAQKESRSIYCPLLSFMIVHRLGCATLRVPATHANMLHLHGCSLHCPVKAVSFHMTPVTSTLLFYATSPEFPFEVSPAIDTDIRIQVWRFLISRPDILFSASLHLNTLIGSPHILMLLIWSAAADRLGSTGC